VHILDFAVVLTLALTLLGRGNKLAYEFGVSVLYSFLGFVTYTLFIKSGAPPSKDLVR